MAISLTDVKRKTKAISAKPASSDVHREKRETLKPWHDVTLTDLKPDDIETTGDESAAKSESKRLASEDFQKSETNGRPVASHEQAICMPLTPKSPANRQQENCAEGSPGKSSADRQHQLASSRNETAAASLVSPAYPQQEKRERDLASISPAIDQQLDSISPAINQQLDSKSTATKSAPIELDSNWTAEKPAARQQKASNSTAESQQFDSKVWTVDALSGKEAEFVYFVFLRCQNAGSRETGNISSHTLCEALNVGTKRLRNLVERLTEKHVVSVTASKRGNGSWRRFLLPEAIYKELALNQLNSRSTATRQPLDSHKTSDWTADKTAGASSSSGSNLDLKTSITSERDGTLPEEWLAVDVTQLANIGFTQTHVRQLHRAGLLTAEELQDSIYAFAFDLEVNGKAKKLNGSPLNFFMGCLRKGPYAPPENFEPPEVRQRRLYLEAKEKAAKARRELEEKLAVLEFDDWINRLSASERIQLVPETHLLRVGNPAHNNALREHFQREVWPSLNLKSQ